MGALPSMPERAAERLDSLRTEARRKAEYQRVPCVWLRATLGWNSRQVAAVLGWQASSVRRTQARYLRHGEEALRDRPQGGRHYAHLTVEEEQNLLASFLEKAAQGEVIVAAPVHQADAKKLGHPFITPWSTSPRRVHGLTHRLRLDHLCPFERELVLLGQCRCLLSEVELDFRSTNTQRERRKTVMGDKEKGKFLTGHCVSGSASR